MLKQARVRYLLGFLRRCSIENVITIMRFKTFESKLFLQAKVILPCNMVAYHWKSNDDEIKMLIRRKS